MTLVGKQLGTYQIVSLLGEGAISFVYRARQDNCPDPSMRDVALKVIKPKLFNYDELVERFKRESHISAELDHPNIIKVYNSGEIDQTQYLSMQPLTGGSLAQRTKNKQLAYDEISAVLDQIASALDYAHAKQIVHRDLKPENILFDANDTAILTDFGMVKPLTLDSITGKNTVLGTPAYMSPEQVRLKPVDGRSDVYSLGIILFELLAGDLPFESNTSMAMMAMHVRTEPPLVSSKQPSVPPELDQVVNKAIAKNPDDRFATAGELAAAFKGAAFGASTKKLPRKTAKTKPLSVSETVISRRTSADEHNAASQSAAPSARMIGLFIVIAVAIVALTVAIVFLLGSVSIPTN